MQNFSEADNCTTEQLLQNSTVDGTVSQYFIRRLMCHHSRRGLHNDNRTFWIEAMSKLAVTEDKWSSALKISVHSSRLAASGLSPTSWSVAPHHVRAQNRWIFFTILRLLKRKGRAEYQLAFRCPTKPLQCTSASCMIQ